MLCPRVLVLDLIWNCATCLFFVYIIRANTLHVAHFSSALHVMHMHMSTLVFLMGVLHCVQIFFLLWQLSQFTVVGLSNLVCFIFFFTVGVSWPLSFLLLGLFLSLITSTFPFADMSESFLLLLVDWGHLDGFLHIFWSCFWLSCALCCPLVVLWIGVS